MADEIREILRGDIVFTAYADEAIDSGDLVKSTSSDDAVDSTGIASLADGDIKVSMCDNTGDDELCVGIALNDASASGAYISVATRGLYIVRASETIATGTRVAAGESDPQEVDAFDSTEEETIIGVALTGASTTDTYLVILLNV